MRSGDEYLRPTTPPPYSTYSLKPSPSPPPSSMPPLPSLPWNGTFPNADQKAGTNTHPLGQDANPHTPGHGIFTQTTGSDPGPTPPTRQTSGPIKVMSRDASVRGLTYTDDDNSARDFLDLCEDVMGNNSITSDADKIAFVSARVKMSSKSFKWMRVRALTKPTERGDYDCCR